MVLPRVLPDMMKAVRCQLAAFGQAAAIHMGWFLDCCGSSASCPPRCLRPDPTACSQSTTARSSPRPTTASCACTPSTSLTLACRQATIVGSQGGQGGESVMAERLLVMRVRLCSMHLVGAAPAASHACWRSGWEQELGNAGRDPGSGLVGWHALSSSLATAAGGDLRPAAGLWNVLTWHVLTPVLTCYVLMCAALPPYRLELQPLGEDLLQRFDETEQALLQARAGFCGQ